MKALVAQELSGPSGLCLTDVEDPAEVVRSAPDESEYQPRQRVTTLSMLGGWTERPLGYGAGRRRPSKIADGEFDVMASDFLDLGKLGA